MDESTSGVLAGVPALLGLCGTLPVIHVSQIELRWWFVLNELRRHLTSSAPIDDQPLRSSRHCQHHTYFLSTGQNHENVRTQQRKLDKDCLLTPFGSYHPTSNAFTLHRTSVTSLWTGYSAYAISEPLIFVPCTR
jgi:hypothetical protein